MCCVPHSHDARVHASVDEQHHDLPAQGGGGAAGGRGGQEGGGNGGGHEEKGVHRRTGMDGGRSGKWSWNEERSSLDDDCLSSSSRQLTLHRRSGRGEKPAAG